MSFSLAKLKEYQPQKTTAEQLHEDTKAVIEKTNNFIWENVDDVTLPEDQTVSINYIFSNNTIVSKMAQIRLPIRAANLVEIYGNGSKFYLVLNGHQIVKLLPKHQLDPIAATVEDLIKKGVNQATYPDINVALFRYLEKYY